jgi:hypothetical protein
MNDRHRKCPRGDPLSADYDVDSGRDGHVFVARRTRICTVQHCLIRLQQAYYSVRGSRRYFLWRFMRHRSSTYGNLDPEILALLLGAITALIGR